MSYDAVCRYRRLLGSLKDGSPSFGFGIEATVFREALPFEAREEAFVGGIVIAVAFRAHALRQTIESDELSKLFAGVLAATIRMKEGATALR